MDREGVWTASCPHPLDNRSAVAHTAHSAGDCFIFGRTKTPSARERAPKALGKAGERRGSTLGPQTEDRKRFPSKPAVSRVLFPREVARTRVAIIPLGRALPRGSSDLTREDSAGPAAQRSRDAPPLFGLAPGGVCRAALVTESAVRSYRTVSPLPYSVARARRSLLCGTFLRVTSTGRYPAPCPVEPGLSSPGLSTGGDRLSDSDGNPTNDSTRARTKPWR